MDPSAKRRIVLTARQKQGMVRSFIMLAPFGAIFLFLAFEGTRLLAATESSVGETLYGLSVVCRRFWILLILGVWIALMPVRFGLVNNWPKARRLFRQVIVLGCGLLLLTVGLVYGLTIL